MSGREKRGERSRSKVSVETAKRKGAEMKGSDVSQIWLDFGFLLGATGNQFLEAVEPF